MIDNLNRIRNFLDSLLLDYLNLTAVENYAKARALTIGVSHVFDLSEDDLLSAFAVRMAEITRDELNIPLDIPTLKALGAEQVKAKVLDWLVQKQD